MSTENTNPEQRYVYIGYQGKDNPTERERIMHLLDTYSTTEGFVAQYLPKWIDVSPSETVKGGLRTVQGREALHARLMKTRLRELGGDSNATIPEIRREKEVPFFASADHSDVDKLKVLSDLFGDGEAFLSAVTDVIDQITDDLLTRELLRTILDNEMESITWVQEMYRAMSADQAAPV
jgi:ferritin-like protein